MSHGISISRSFTGFDNEAELVERLLERIPRRNVWQFRTFVLYYSVSKGSRGPMS